MQNFNDRVRQLLLLSLIILLIYLSLRELRLFMPGLLGAITLYILSRANYFQLVFTRKWKKGNAAFLFIIFYLLILGVPVFAAVALLSPKISSVFSDPTAVINNIKQAVMQVQAKAGVAIVTEKSLTSSLDQTINFIPSLLNSTLNLLSNLITMLFFLYYLLYHGREVEMTLFRIIPLKDANTSMLASETKKMVKANAIGIPLISIIQGLVATLGYFIFGVKEFALWGFFTGVFAFFPVIGTMVVWVPLVIYMYVSGETWNATGLMFYSLLVTGNIDYVARVTIMKKMGNVHPVITVLGVLIGLGLFGFIGLIFGPLLVSYIVVLFRIYLNEFTHQPLDEKKPDESAVINKEPKT
ncbi:MAG TPA: AI-2E family transporter [Chitinophagaceae bacterium]|nr:AI-2E family transporter [Chitinophagaceae bacterium]